MADKRLGIVLGIGAGLGLLFLGRKKAKAASRSVSLTAPPDVSRKFQAPPDRNLSKNFRLYEMIPRPSDWGWHQPTQQEWTNLTNLINRVLQPLRSRFGSVKVTSAVRPTSLRNIHGLSIKEHLVQKGYHPAQVSDHEFWAAADIKISRQLGPKVWMKVYQWLINETLLPDVRRVMFYWVTAKSGKKIPSYFHVAVVRPGKTRLRPVGSLYLDNKPATVKDLV